MAEIEFVNSPSSLNPKETFVAHLEGIVGKEALLTSIGSLLRFPEYYGKNWDALEECLRDLHWLDAKEVLLVHNDTPRLQEPDFRIYLQILFEVLRSWPANSEYQLRVIFPKEDESRIRFMLD